MSDAMEGDEGWRGEAARGMVKGVFFFSFQSLAYVAWRRDVTSMTRDLGVNDADADADDDADDDADVHRRLLTIGGVL